MHNSMSTMAERLAMYRAAFSTKNENPTYRLNCTPSPYYTLFSQEAITKQSVNENVYTQKRKSDYRSFKSQENQKQAPTPDLYDYSTIFNLVKPKNSPTYFYKNKLYIIGQMSPSLYKHEKVEIKMTDPYTKETISKVKEYDDQPERINNTMQVPVYLFEHKAWTIQKFRIRYISTYADNYIFLQPSRIPDSTLRQKAREAQVARLCGQPFRKIERQKPACYFPNELTNMAYCKDNQMTQIAYFFGGVYEQRLGYSNKTYKMDFDMFFIQMYEQKGDIPDPREGAVMFYYSGSWLILHGGYNMLNCQVYSDFYIFNLQSKNWSLIEVDFESCFTPRINFSLAYNPSTKSCFLFGGTILDHQNRECLLDDMYEFKVIEEETNERRTFFNRKFKGKVQTKTLLPKKCGKWPQKVKGHKAFWIDKYTMIVLGGQLAKEQIDLETTFQSSIQMQESQKDQGPKLNKKIWMFDTRTKQWNEVLPQKVQFNGCIDSCMDFRVKVLEDTGEADLITFGGFDTLKITEVRKLTFHTKDYDNFVRNLYAPECEVCVKKQLSYQQKPVHKSHITTFPAGILTQFIHHSMPFVFAAFGHLTSLAVESQSSRINFHYSCISEYKLTGLQVEADGYLPYTAQEISQKIHNFTVHDSMEVQGVTDKKYKIHQTRLNGITTFCNRLKMSALRLGHEFLWVACNGYNQILVYWLKEKTENLGSCQTKVYKSYFYALDETTMEILPQFSPEIKKRVEDSHADFLKDFYKCKKHTKSVIKILDLRKLKEGDSKDYRYELTPDYRRNNILANFDTITERSSIFSKSLILQQSIDINLKSYLSMYFLQRQIKIFLKVQLIGPYYPPVIHKPKPIQKQPSQNSENNTNPDPPKNRSSFVNKVQQYMSEHTAKSKQVLPLPDGPASITYPKYEEINFQFMLPKIDDKIQKGELIEVQLDCFGEFDCKIIEVYYWLGKRGNLKANSEKAQNQLNQDELLYSNGLLIYHKGQLIKRYKHPLGMLLLGQNSRQTKNITKTNPKNTDQYYSSLNQYNTRLFGLIQVNDKYITNITNTDFLHEQFLQKLYERIENVSMLYEKMYGNWNGVEVGKIKNDEDKNDENDDRNDKNDRNEENEGKPGRKKVKLSQDNQSEENEDK